MRYMLLVHHNEGGFGKLSKAEQQDMLQESVRLTHQLNSKGQYLDAAPLHPTSMGATVRVRNGKRLVTDGPYAETREQLGGYFLVEARDLDEAISIASQIPGGRIGSVEIRRVMEIAGFPMDSNLA